MSIARNNAIDTLKGIMILLVVAGHVTAPPENIIIPIIQEWIYIFHMPAFFILGGLFIRKTREELRSILPLLICYIFWLTLNKRNPDVAARAFLYSNWDSLKSILWFLPALISFKLILSIQIKAHWRNGALVFLTTFIIIFHNQIQKEHNLIPWGLDIAFYLFPMALISKYFYDIKISNSNIIIEVNGDFWHGNPLFYKEDDIINHPFQPVVAKSLWIKDEKKKTIAENKGFKVIYIWENEIKENNRDILTFLINRLNE